MVSAKKCHSISKPHPIWSVGSRMLQVAYLIENAQALGITLSPSDEDKVKKISDILYSERKTNVVSKRRYRKLGKVERDMITTVNDDLLDVFKFKNKRNLDFKLDQSYRSEKISEIFSFFGYFITVEESSLMALSFAKLQKYDQNNSGESIDSPQRAADFSLSLLLGVSPKTIRRIRTANMQFKSNQNITLFEFLNKKSVLNNQDFKNKVKLLFNLN